MGSIVPKIHDYRAFRRWQTANQIGPAIHRAEGTLQSRGRQPPPGGSSTCGLNCRGALVPAHRVFTVDGDVTGQIRRSVSAAGRCLELPALVAKPLIVRGSLLNVIGACSNVWGL